jgi:hypothetical protein
VEPLGSPIIDPEFIKSLPVRLPPISSDELEHIEDQWLDDAYERKLSFSGDDLAAISSVKPFVASLVAEPQIGIRSASTPTSSASTSAAVALALSETVDNSVVENVQLPALGDDPTEQELLAYANAHPAVRAALKVFRGKVVGAVRDPRP